MWVSFLWPNHFHNTDGDEKWNILCSCRLVWTGLLCGRVKYCSSVDAGSIEDIDKHSTLDALSTHDPYSVVFDLTVVDCITTAEKFLESVEGKEEYNVLLLQIVDDASADGLIRFAAAIAFKNSVKRNWRIVSSGK